MWGGREIAFSHMQKPDNVSAIPGTACWKERIESFKLSSDLLRNTHTHTLV